MPYAMSLCVFYYVACMCMCICVCIWLSVGVYVVVVVLCVICMCVRVCAARMFMGMQVQVLMCTYSPVYHCLPYSLELESSENPSNLPVSVCPQC